MGHARESRGRQRANNPAPRLRIRVGTPQMVFIEQINELLHPEPESPVSQALHRAMN